MNVKFSNAPIAEASAAFFGAEKRGSGILAAWTGRPDPSLTYSLMFTKDAYYNGGRAPVPPELEAAIKESRASEDIEARRKAFATVQRLVMENAFVAPIAFQVELVAMTANLRTNHVAAGGFPFRHPDSTGTGAENRMTGNENGEPRFQSVG